MCLTHVEKCLANKKKASVNNSDIEDNVEEEDEYWNYKNGEFFIDSIFALSTVFEDFGDGIGMFIICKIVLPIFHGLRHSNYSCSIHRLIVRVLSQSSPKEGMKILHERFYNREGKPGRNIFKGNIHSNKNQNCNWVETK